MKKKIVCAMMCIAMAATSLAGCGSDDGAAIPMLRQTSRRIARMMQMAAMTQMHPLRAEMERFTT